MSVANPEQHVTTEGLADVMSKSRRRIAIRLLGSEPVDGSMRLDEVAREVAAIEHGRSPSHISPSEVKRVRLSYIKHHIPVMMDHNIVERDGNRLVCTGGTQTALDALESLRFIAKNGHRLEHPDPQEVPQ